MFPFRRKKKKKPTPAWVLWLVVAFLAYMAFTNKNAPTPAPATQNNAAKENSGEATTPPAEGNKPSIAHALGIEPNKILNVDALKGRFMPQPVIKLHVKDNTEGSGQIAICGQNVTISYSSSTEDKKEIEKDQTASFQIGDGKVMPALEVGVVGMKKNGERTVFSPPDMAYGAENFLRKEFAAANVDFDVKLLAVSPELPETGAYRVLGDGRGQEEGYSCGSKTKLHIALWSVEGKRLYSSRDNNGSPISFTIGKSEVFLGLEQGVMNMMPGMRRNMIVPPAYQKTLLGNAPAIDFPLPKNQIVLVDVEAVAE